MVNSAIAGSSRAASVDVSVYATNVKANKVNNFSDVMAKSLSDNSSVTNNNSSKAECADVKETKASQPKEFRSEKADETDVTKTDDYADNEKKEEVVAEVESAAKDILDKIEEELNISEEELNECMEILGMSLMDLLQPGNILKLVMEATGTQDAMVVVTDSELSDALKNILDFAGARIGELSDQLDMTPDQLQSMIDDWSDAQMQTDNSDAVVETENVAKESVVQDDISKEVTEPEGTSETVEDVVASKITVEKGGKPETEGNMNNTSGGNEQQADVQTENGAVTEANVLDSTISKLTETFETVLSAESPEVNQADIVRQVVDSIKLNNTNMLQSIEVALNPENLGKVNVLVTVREGVISAQIVAENEQVKKALESQMSMLKETFEAQGIKVEAVEVTVQSRGFENNQAFEGEKEQDNSTSKARKKINLDGLNFDEEDEETIVETNVTTHENSSVEYLA